MEKSWTTAPDISQSVSTEFSEISDLEPTSTEHGNLPSVNERLGECHRTKDINRKLPPPQLFEASVNGFLSGFCSKIHMYVL